jgi:drug/metabolite transporter, DME family
MGVALALAGALAFSFMNVLIRKGVRPGDIENGVLTTVIVNVLIFTPMLVIFSLLEQGPRWNTMAIVWFAAAGLCATYLGRTALFAGIRHLGAARAAAIKNATPLVSVALGISILGERLSVVAVIGIGLVLLGIFLLTLESFMRQMPRERAAGDVVELAFASETLAEGGPWQRTRGHASRWYGLVTADSRRTVLVGASLSGLAALFFGSGHAFSKAGMDLMPNALMGSTVGAWTALSIYLGSAVVRGQVRSTAAATLGTFRPYFWLAGVAGSIGKLSFFAALNFAPVSHVSVVAAAETVLTVALAATLIRPSEGVTRRLVVPAILVFGGSTLIAVAR